MLAATDLFSTYRKAESLLASGDLRQAADLCQQILNADPQFAYGHHLMASLFRQTGSFDKALVFAHTAVRLSPETPMFCFQQAQLLFVLGNYISAIEALKQVHKLQPENAMALVLWADACARQGEFDQALKQFARARAINDVPEIDEHEGLCLQLKGDLDGAQILFDRLIARRPDYEGGYLHKAKFLRERNQDNEAEACYARALKCNPQSAEALREMAVLADRRGQADMAITYATQALQAPRNSMLFDTLLFLGGLLLKKSNISAAQQVFQQAVEMKPDDLSALHPLIDTLWMQGREQEAVPYVEAALAKKPGDPVLTHLQAVLRGKNTETAPQKYVSELFDAHADQFDTHLQKELGYRIPFLMAEYLGRLPQFAGKRDIGLLDLGCGTGLMGEALRDVTSLRIGVDLSEKMLEKARVKQLYAELHHLDIIEFAMGTSRSFDIVSAADVLVYIGNLAPLFKAVRNALAADGVFAISIEQEHSDQDFRLNISGRYSHSLRYIERLAADEGYVIMHRQETVLRTEGGTPLKGVVFFLKKTQTH